MSLPEHICVDAESSLFRFIQRHVGLLVGELQDVSFAAPMHAVSRDLCDQCHPLCNECL